MTPRLPCRYVKLADKLDNVRDALNSPHHGKPRRTPSEARDFYLTQLVPTLPDPARQAKMAALLGATIAQVGSGDSGRPA